MINNRLRPHRRCFNGIQLTASCRMKIVITPRIQMFLNVCMLPFANSKRTEHEVGLRTLYEDTLIIVSERYTNVCKQAHVHKRPPNSRCTAYKRYTRHTQITRTTNAQHRNIIGTMDKINVTRMADTRHTKVTRTTNTQHRSII